MKCNIINGSIVDGLRQPILFSFVLDRPPGYKEFSKPKTILFERINKLVFNTTLFYLDDNNGEIDFNGETLTFTLQLIKI